MTNINRRGFLFGSAAAAAFAGCSTAKAGVRELKPGEKRNVAMIGVGIQGRSLLQSFLAQPNDRVVAICDESTSATTTVPSARPTSTSATFWRFPRSTRCA